MLDSILKLAVIPVVHIFLPNFGSYITLQPKTGCPLKLSRAEPGQYLDGRPPGKTRLLLEEVLVRPARGAHQYSDGDTILSTSTVFRMRH